MESSAELVLIPKENARAAWPHAGKFIAAAALASQEISADRMLAGCERGTMQLWLAWSGACEAAAITELQDTITGRVCLVVACGGHDMDRWLCLLDEIETWARTQQGAKKMRIYGRKGWARKLPDYRVKRVILDKEL